MMEPADIEIVSERAPIPGPRYCILAHKPTGIIGVGIGRSSIEARQNALERLAAAVSDSTDTPKPDPERLVMIPARLLHDLTGPDPCSFDHHGGCQAHGFLSLEPGELCPHAEARIHLNDDDL